jgi:two-component system cell cycle sensor histidine kinase/response regulator CckA
MREDGLFRAIFSQAAVGIAQTSLTGDWLLVNDRFCEILGYTQAELRTRTFLDITHPEDRDASLAAMRQLLNCEISSWMTEKRYIRKYGNVVWGRLFVSLVRDRNDQPQYFIAVVEEVTDKVLAERSLLESQQQLRLAVSAGLGVWECDLRRGAVALSPQYQRVFGQPPLSFGEWMNLIHPDDVERVVAIAREGVDRTHRWEAEFRVLWPDGSVRWMISKATVIVDEGGRPARMVGVSLDITDRKQAEAALRESEERFRLMANTAPVMIWVSGTNKLCTFFNKPWLDFTGRTMEEELGNGWADGVHAEDLEHCLDIYFTAFEARSNFQMEYRLRHAGGEYRWVLDNGTPLYREGEFVGYIGSCIDITDHKLIEQRLLSNEVQLTDAQRLAKVGSFEVHIDSDSLYWSDEISRIFGVTNRGPSDFATFLQSVHPQDREKVLESARKVRSTGATIETEYHVVRPDGEVRFVRSIVEAIKNDRGKPVRLAGATQDVTEQVLAREHLRESEQRFRRVFEEGPLGLALVGKDYRFEKVNHALCQMVGYSETELRQMSFADITHPDDVLPDMGLAEKLFRSEIPFYQLRKRYLKKSGEIIWINLTASVVRDRNGEALYGIAMVEDVTAAKQAEENALARQKLESVGVLAGGIAHDFNNLLGGILGQAELIEAELPTRSPLHEEIRRIKTAAVRGSEIVRELMIYSGNETRNFEPTDFSKLVEEMLALLRVSISKRATLKTNLEENLPKVWANPPEIRQVVMNLIINASEAIGEDEGVIEVTTSRVADGKSVHSGSARELSQGDYVLLEVSDTGCGLTEEQRTRIFDPFFTTKFAGRGLGLAVVQGIVGSHRGIINVVSTAGQGTAFHVYLPCASQSSDSRDIVQEKRPRSESLAGRTVLVVEDEEVLRHSLVRMLRIQGLSVLEAEDGTAAIRLLRKKKYNFDTILLDLTIPGASSREVIDEAQRVRPEMTLIIASAHSRASAEHSLKMHISAFLRKPFQFSDVIHALRETLSS